MYTDQPWAWIVTLIVGYLCGSFSGSITASRRFHKTDIRKYGSGNAGMTNALRTFGKKTALLVTLMDAAKTLIPLFLGRWLIGDATVVAAGAGVILGHAFPLYYKFKGGKCVLSSAVIILFMDWRVFAVAIGLFLILAFVTKIVAVGSLAAALSAPFATYFILGQRLETIFIACLATFIIILHRDNIKRLIEGREPKTIGQQKGENQ